MKISRKSWHYRWLAISASQEEIKSGYFPPRNLCHYVGRLLRWSLWWLLWLSIPAFFFIWAIVLIIRNWAEVWPLLLFLSVVTPLLVYCLVKMIETSTRQAAKTKEAADPPREPKTLLGKWLKAKKEKVCPMIEYDD